MHWQKIIMILGCLCLPLAAGARVFGYGWNSLEALEKAALEGNPRAEADLGKYYMLAEEYDQALPWLKKAAKQKEPEGFYGLGFCYEYGVCGLEQNIKKAAAYYKKAARKDSPGGLYKTALFLHDGTGMKANPRKALVYMERAAEKASSPAQRFLAEAYMDGKTDAVTQDYKKAAFYWRKLAASGTDAQACFNLGYLYYYGYGVAKDVHRAFEWDLCAAQAGLAQGQYQVGQAYLNGEGVSVDMVQALSWLEKAAAQGYEPARQLLENISYYVYQGPETGAKSVGHIESAAELQKRAEAGDPGAQYLYGSLCESVLRANAVPCDPLIWYQKAAAQGLAAAQEKLRSR